VRTHRRPCLDLAHRFRDMTCPRCRPARADHDDVVSTARRRHARTTAEDTDGFGWTA
jgi:hypothetical protein